MLLEAQGDYAAAKPLLEQALAIDKEALGEKHPGYATDLNNLAELLEAQGDYAAAKPLFEQALAIRKAVLGEHPDTAQPDNLAGCSGQGDYAAARPLYEQALASQGGLASATDTAQPEQPGVLLGAGGLRRRQAPLRAGPGDPQGGAGRAPPRHRPSLNNLAKLL